MGVSRVRNVTLAVSLNVFVILREFKRVLSQSAAPVIAVLAQGKKSFQASFLAAPTLKYAFGNNIGGVGCSEQTCNILVAS